MDVGDDRFYTNIKKTETHLNKCLECTRLPTRHQHHHLLHHQALFATMEATGADFTMTFVGLMALDPTEKGTEGDEGNVDEVGLVDAPRPLSCMFVYESVNPPLPRVVASTPYPPTPQTPHPPRR